VSDGISRRKLLSGVVTATAVGTAGCLGGNYEPLNASLSAESQYFKSVEAALNSHDAFTDELVVRLHNTVPRTPRVILFFQNGEQEDFEELVTGEKRAEIVVDFDREQLPGGLSVSVAAVAGGEAEGYDWIGGDVLERVSITVREVPEL